MNKIKVFLAYHKDTPIYKSETFCPIQAGAVLSNYKLDMLRDNSGDNISNLNKYYCELTTHYWVLKNYLPNSDDKYIGFAHYRRLIDFENISDKESPSIYGMSMSEAETFFKDINNKDLYSYCEPYDIILPSKVYMYRDTVNPILRENENLNMYEHFIAEHNNDLADILKDVVKNNFSEYYSSIIDCYQSEKAHFYNMFIMKTNIAADYLKWEFEVLKKVGEYIGGWENTQYFRMAGFLSELLINIWLKKNIGYKIGYFPIYMIDFETEYIQNANKYIEQNNIQSAIKELKKLLKYTTDKLSIYSAIYELCLKTNDKESEIYLAKSIEIADTADDYYNLASITQKYSNNKQETIMLYKQAVEKEPTSKYYINCLLYYSERNHDIEATRYAWEKLKKLGFNNSEEEKYEHFIKIYRKIQGL